MQKVIVSVALVYISSLDRVSSLFRSLSPISIQNPQPTAKPATYHQTLELELVDAEHSDRLGGICPDRRGVEQMEEAVKLLVEHLLKPVLPQGLERHYRVPEKQSAAAPQVRTTPLHAYS